MSYLDHVLDILTRNKKKPAILLSSSIQATQDNPYGESKLQGERLLQESIPKSMAIRFIFIDGQIYSVSGVSRIITQ